MSEESAGAGQLVITGVRGGSGFITNSPFALALAGSGGAHGPYMVPGVNIPIGAAAVAGVRQAG